MVAVAVVVGLVVAAGLVVMIRRRRRSSAESTAADSFRTPRDAGRALRERVRRSEGGASEPSEDPSLEEATSDQAFWDALARPASTASSVSSAPPSNPNSPTAQPPNS